MNNTVNNTVHNTTVNNATVKYTQVINNINNMTECSAGVTGAGKTRVINFFIIFTLQFREKKMRCNRPLIMV